MKVEYIQHMGSDLTVVNAARVSFDKESEWASGGMLSERDTKLIRYLARHQHWTPFAHCMITLRLKMPIFVARQWFKHTVGFTRNEVSRRYVDSPPEFFVPSEWRARAEDKKQGSGEALFTANGGQAFFYQHFVDSAAELYGQLIGAGVCPEQARMVLPQSMYTEFYETASLAAYARLCALRLSPDTQKETRQCAEAVNDLLAPLYPVSWEALTRHDR